jgi:hypothetical protein
MSTRLPIPRASRTLERVRVGPPRTMRQPRQTIIIRDHLITRFAAKYYCTRSAVKSAVKE